MTWFSPKVGKAALTITAARCLRKLGLIDHRRRKNGLLILMMHKVNNDEDPLPLTTSPALFERIIREIAEHHEIVSLPDTDLRKAAADQKKLKIAITFDDGYRDNYQYAFPILGKL